MDEAGLRARLAGLPPATLPFPSGPAVHHDALIPAAVLVAIVLGREPGVLLTKRAPKLARHAGQVCFPGGQIEARDVSPAAAALREAGEEVGIAPGAISLLGRLPDYATGTGFQIMPVVGLASEPLHLAVAPTEVEAAFLLPMATLLDASAPFRRCAERDGRQRSFWVWPHPRHEIWGATAAILVSLARILRT